VSEPRLALAYAGINVHKYVVARPCRSSRLDTPRNRGADLHTGPRSAIIPHAGQQHQFPLNSPAWTPSTNAAHSSVENTKGGTSGFLESRTMNCPATSATSTQALVPQ
jgi:hypothetical protein